MSDTVQQEELPRVHHAEIVSVRREDTTSVSEGEEEDSSSQASSNSDTSDDEERSVNSRNIMINIKPVSEPGGASSSSTTDGGSSDSNTEQVTPRLEAPPQKQNIWGASRQKPSPSTQKHAIVPPLFVGDDDTDSRDQQQLLTEKYFPEPENFSYEQMQLYREEMKDVPCSTPRDQEEQLATAEQDSPPMPHLVPARGHFETGGLRGLCKRHFKGLVARDYRSMVFFITSYLTAQVHWGGGNSPL